MKRDEKDSTSGHNNSAMKSGAMRSLYGELWRLLSPDIRGKGRALVAAYLLSLVGIGATFCAPLFLAAMLDNALQPRDMHLFLKYAAAIILSLAVFFVFSLLKTWYLAGASERIFLSLRRRLVSTLLKKPLMFFSVHETGDLITRTSNDTERLSELIFDYYYAGINSLTMIIVFITLMLAWEWQLGLFTLLSLPCYVLLLSLLQKPLFRAARAARERLSGQNDTLLDILSGAREIRFYQQYPVADNRFSNIAELFTAANIRSVLIGEWAYNGMEFFSRFIALMPFLIGGYWICSGSSVVTVGSLIAYNLYMTYIAYCLEILNVGVTKFSQAAPLIQRIREILDSPEETAGRAETVSEIVDNPIIEFRNVYFSHDPARPLIRDFSLVIEPGEKVALMGPSGAGKSTLIDLLTRQLRPNSGEILFGGQPIDSYSLRMYLLHFAYVRQKPYIFKTSVRENIAAGWYEIPMDVIIDAAKRVDMHEAIMRLPKGYDTVIGTAGLDLSAGQLQRLALARALAREPEVLLLDEFTSALDRATEEEILNNLFLNFPGQTIICVTHSQVVAEHFARIVRIEKP